MYRDPAFGLAERIRNLEEERAQLEADLLQKTRIRRPQRLLQAAALATVLAAVASVSAAAGFRMGIESGRASASDENESMHSRLNECRQHLRTVVRDELSQRYGYTPEG